MKIFSRLASELLHFLKNKGIALITFERQTLFVFLKCFSVFSTLKNQGQSKIPGTQQMFTVKPETHFSIPLTVTFLTLESV